MPTSLIFLTTLKNVKFIIHLSLVIIKFVLPTHRSETFLYIKNWLLCLTSFQSERNNDWWALHFTEV